MPLSGPPAIIIQQGNAQAMSPREIVQWSGDVTVPETYGGIYQMTAGSTTTLPTYSENQKGLEYNIKNGSSGTITVMAADGETINSTTGTTQFVTLQPGNSRNFARLANNPTTWIIH